MLRAAMFGAVWMAGMAVARGDPLPPSVTILPGTRVDPGECPPSPPLYPVAENLGFLKLRVEFAEGPFSIDETGFAHLGPRTTHISQADMDGLWQVFSEPNLTTTLTPARSRRPQVEVVSFQADGTLTRDTGDCLPPAACQAIVAEARRLLDSYFLAEPPATRSFRRLQWKGYDLCWNHVIVAGRRAVRLPQRTFDEVVAYLMSPRLIRELRQPPCDVERRVKLGTLTLDTETLDVTLCAEGLPHRLTAFLAALGPACFDDAHAAAGQ
jgi:hypothetical protein